MSITAQNLIDRASVLLSDQGKARWPDGELLGWLNDGRREIARVRPDRYATAATVSLAAGVKQSLPAGAAKLIKVVRVTSGAPVTLIPREWLDRQQLDWMTRTGTANLLHYMYEPDEPTVFYVYPPATAGASLDLVYQPALTDFTANSTLTGVEEPLAGSLVNYLCHRAYLKGADYAGDPAQADRFYQLFLAGLVPTPEPTEMPA